MADIFTADMEGATPFSGFTSAAASVTQVGSPVHGGAGAALHTATGGTFPILAKTIAGAPTTLVAQLWFYVPASVPNGLSAITIARVRCSFFNILFKLNDTTGFGLQMQMSDGANTFQQTATYVEDSWTRLTMRATLTPAITVDWNIGTTEMTQVVYGFAGTTDVQEFLLGASTLATGLTHYTDDLRLSTTSADYDTYKGAAAAGSSSSLALLGVS
jgi:hypothetical protein